MFTDFASQRTAERRARLFTIAALLTISLGFCQTASAQEGDRQLLASGGGDPYVMILFDTSGSMALATECTASDRADGYCEGGSEAGEDCTPGDTGGACVTGGGECLALCSHDCSGPNCPRPMNGDDPDSKIYQAKDALYSVMKDTTGVNWGFASLNQDTLAVGAKHWLYEVSAVAGGGPDIPAVGWKEVFGAQTGGSGNTQFDMTCDRNGGGNANNAELYETGCYATSQDAPVYTDTSTDNYWELEKIRRLPKGGQYGTNSVTYYARSAASGSYVFYRVTYGALNSGAGAIYASTDTFSIPVTIESCGKNDVAADGLTCSTGWATIANRTVTFTRLDGTGARDPHLGEFLWWEGTASTESDFEEDAYFGGRTDGEPELPGVGHYASDIYADKTCRGWEPSGETAGSSDSAEWGQQGSVSSEVDSFTEVGTSYDLRWPKTHNVFPGLPATFSGYEWIFDYGDVIPLDWTNDNLSAVLTRLNPKHPTVDDDSFMQSPFFADSYGGGEHFLRLATEDVGASTAVDEGVRPLIAHGSTPLAGWFSMFRNWYSGCGDPGNCRDEFVGWSDIAAQFAPNFACSKKYVLMITDGGETCDGTQNVGAEDYYEDFIEEFPDGFSKTADQCRYRASLNSQEDVKTMVIGFGTENHAKLQCANTPVFFANNKGELVKLLVQLIGEIQESSASFASAAVPTVQANILDKVYLSSFVPLNDSAVWPGRVDAFLKPLPLDDDNLPDRGDDVRCVDPTKLSECFAWDAGDSQLAWDGDPGYAPERLLLQAPLESEIETAGFNGGVYDDSTLQIGYGENERRVYFGLPDSNTLQNRRQLFDFPADPATADDGATENFEPTELANFEYVWNIDPSGQTVAQRRQTVANVISFTLQEKQAEIDHACTAGNSTLLGRSCTSAADCGESATGANDGVCTTDAKIQYVMGDIFHSNPLILNPPSDFDFFTKNLYWPGDGTLSNDPGTGLCGESAAQTALRGSQISYAWYSNKNLCRRVQMFVGSNDGQLHAFDAGVFDGTKCQLDFASSAGDTNLEQTGVNAVTTGTYDFGTGRELFSFIPSTMMPLVYELSTLSDLTTQWGVDGSPLAADVFVDPYIAANGSAECEDRVWRTLVLSTYRSGGPGFFALDVTQPDVFDEPNNMPTPVPGSLDYVPSCAEGGSNCDLFCRNQSGNVDTDCAALRYPSLRWEFRDLDALGNPADYDSNGQTDLAESWSRPFIARLSVCEGACDTDSEPEDRYVAIFGGGVAEEPFNDASDRVGNVLYMVDVETGKAIYKRGGDGPDAIGSVVGSIPADITGVDFDTDGRVDTLYFGTTAGFVYKVDLGNGPFSLDDDDQIEDPSGQSGAYDPFQVFSTGGRPIYLEVGAVFVARERSNAILFGTGNRADLWEASGETGRFYTILDDNWSDSNRDGVRDGGVLTESSYPAVDPDGTTVADYLYGITGYEKGWYFTLGDNEKLITEPFTLSGITFFTIYDPLVIEDNGVCGHGGESKIFTVNTVTTEGYAIQAGSTERTRYITAPTFTTQPFVTLSATKNPGAENSQDNWTDELREINRELKRLFPRGSRFANYTQDIQTVRSDTGLIFIAPVPIAIEPHNWKEF